MWRSPVDNSHFRLTEPRLRVDWAGAAPRDRVGVFLVPVRAESPGQGCCSDVSRSRSAREGCSCRDRVAGRVCAGGWVPLMATMTAVSAVMATFTAYRVRG